MRIRNYRCVYATGLCLAMSLAAMAQAPPPPPPPDQTATTPAATPPPAPVWSIGPIDFSGLVDVYADKNFNNPASMTNGLRNFDLKANQFTLNMAKLTMSHDADPVGFRVDFGFGRAFETINGSDPAGGDINRHIEQAYVSLKPAKMKGFQLDIGKFVTSAGAEVIETKDNWNYSRSLLFAWAIPYYHFGARASMPMGKYFTGGVQLVNGWNNFEDNNSGKTIGLTGALASKKASWFNNYYTGPENSGSNKRLPQSLRHHPAAHSDGSVQRLCQLRLRLEQRPPRRESELERRRGRRQNGAHQQDSRSRPASNISTTKTDSAPALLKR